MIIKLIFHTNFAFFQVSIATKRIIATSIFCLLILDRFFTHLLNFLKIVTHIVFTENIVEEFDFPRFRFTAAGADSASAH